MNFIPNDHMRNSAVLDQIMQDTDGTLEAARETAPPQLIPQLDAIQGNLARLAVPNINSFNRLTMPKSQLVSGKIAIAALPRRTQFLVDSTMCGLHSEQRPIARSVLKSMSLDRKISLYEIDEALRRTVIESTSNCDVPLPLQFSAIAAASAANEAIRGTEAQSVGRPFIIALMNKRGKHSVDSEALIHELIHVGQWLSRPIMVAPHGVPIEVCKKATICVDEIEAYMKTSQISSLADGCDYVERSSQLRAYDRKLSRVGLEAVSIV
jgi:hypothetical protein